MERLCEINKKVVSLVKQKPMIEIPSASKVPCAGSKCLVFISVKSSKHIAAVCGKYYYFCSEKCYLAWLERGVLHAL